MALVLLLFSSRVVAGVVGVVGVFAARCRFGPVFRRGYEGGWVSQWAKRVTSRAEPARARRGESEETFKVRGRTRRNLSIYRVYRVKGVVASSFRPE